MPSVISCFGLLRLVSAAVRHPSRLMSLKIFKFLRIPINYVLRSSVLDALLVLVPGIMGLATGFRMKTDKYSPSYLEIVCHSMTQWPHYAPSFLLVTSIVSIFVGIFRIAVIGLNSKSTIIYYIYILLVLTLTNFIAGTASAMAGKKIRLGLESSVMEQIKSVYEEGSPLQLNSDLEESWDVLQMQFSCCGAHGYRDYAELAGAKMKKEPLPQSCCTIRWKEEMPKINNQEQCQLDAKLGVRDSIYINMSGCHDHLLVWLKHYLYAQMFVMLSGGMAQVMGIIYIYGIFYRPAANSETRR